VREHRALRQSGRPTGVLQDGDPLARIAQRMLPVAAVVVEQRGEADVLRVAAGLDRELARLHLRRDRVGLRRHLGHVADDELLQARLAEHRRHLRVERREVERDHHVAAAVADLVLEHLCGVERRVVDDRAARLQHAEEGDHVVRRVRKVEADVDAWPDAECLQALGGRSARDFSSR
jgi:hypothetical protein